MSKLVAATGHSIRNCVGPLRKSFKNCYWYQWKKDPMLEIIRGCFCKINRFVVFNFRLSLTTWKLTWRGVNGPLLPRCSLLELYRKSSNLGWNCTFRKQILKVFSAYIWPLSNWKIKDFDGGTLHWIYIAWNRLQMDSEVAVMRWCTSTQSFWSNNSSGILTRRLWHYSFGLLTGSDNCFLDLDS